MSISTASNRSDCLRGLATWSVALVASATAWGQGYTISTVAGTPGQLGDGLPAIAAPLFSPQGVVVDRSGNLVIADAASSRVLRLNRNGALTTIAGRGVPDFDGDGGLATAATLSHPTGLAVDTAGNLYILDSMNNRVRRL